MRILLGVAVFALLAGCAGVDDAKQEIADARAKLDETTKALDEARQDAKEAKERFDRLRSATIVRTEKLDVTLTPHFINATGNATTLTFSFSARRGEVPIPNENVTSLPPVTIRASGVELSCDPVTCRVALPNGTAEISWGGAFQAYPRTPVCISHADKPHTCGQPPLDRKGAEARVTTAVSDVDR